MVDAQQLTSDLGGTFPYSHEDWLHFHQVKSVGILPSNVLLMYYDCRSQSEFSTDSIAIRLAVFDVG